MSGFLIDQEWLKRQNWVVLLKPRFTQVELHEPSNYGNDYYQIPRGNDYLPERVDYRNTRTERPSKRKQFNPDKFDGEKINWTDYLKHFETVFDWNSWGKRDTVSHEFEGSGSEGAG